MANTDLISISLVDINGNRATVPIFVPSGESVLALQTYMEAATTALDDVTAAKIDSASVTLSLNLPAGLKAAATAGHFINQGANFAFDAANTPYRHTIRVPAILETLLNGEQVDTTDAAVIAWRDNILNGVGAVVPSDRYANDLVALLQALLTFRQS
jgi:hypothetical protein